MPIIALKISKIYLLLCIELAHQTNKQSTLLQ